MSHFVFLSSIDPRRSSPLTFPPSLSLVPYIFLPLPNLFSSLPAFSSFLARSTDRARPFSCCDRTSTSSHFFPRTSSLFFLSSSSLISPPTSPYYPLFLFPFSPLLPRGSFAHVADLTIGGFEGSAWRAREKSSGFSGIAQIHRSDPPFAPSSPSPPSPLPPPSPAPLPPTVPCPFSWYIRIGR